MSKQWKITRDEVHKSPFSFGKLSNPAKFNELYQQLDAVCQIFKHQETVKTTTRKVVEEVVNIIQHNKTWNEIMVRTEANGERSRFKAEIFYDGGEYYDPEKHKIGNVVGSRERFKEYSRTYKIRSDNTVEIRINIAL